MNEFGCTLVSLNYLTLLLLQILKARIGAKRWIFGTLKLTKKAGHPMDKFFKNLKNNFRIDSPIKWANKLYSF